jgi:hypothetical protein
MHFSQKALVSLVFSFGEFLLLGRPLKLLHKVILNSEITNGTKLLEEDSTSWRISLKVFLHLPPPLQR